MEQCIFCKIVKGELPSQTVHETDTVLAFIAKEQVSKGHTLVIPKEHAENILDIEEDALSSVMQVTKEVSEQCMKGGATGVNILHASGKDAQQSVFHFHIHAVPRYPHDGLDLWLKVGIENE